MLNDIHYSIFENVGNYLGSSARAIEAVMWTGSNLSELSKLGPFYLSNHTNEVMIPSGSGIEFFGLGDIVIKDGNEFYKCNPHTFDHFFERL